MNKWLNNKLNIHELTQITGKTTSLHCGSQILTRGLYIIYFVTATIMDKSPWDSNAVFIIFCNFWIPPLNSRSLSKFSCRSPFLHPIKSWNLKQILDTSVHCYLWGEGLGMCELENAPEMQ